MRVGPATQWVKRRLGVVQYLFDAAAWAIALPLVASARYDFVFRKVNHAGLLRITLVAVLLQGVVGPAFGLYRKRFPYGSFDEVRALASSIATVAVVTFAIAHLHSGAWIPRSAPIVGAFVALVFASGIRYVRRLLEEVQLRPSAKDAEPVVVFGAGEAGRQIVRLMMRSAGSSMRPVALLDDDPDKAHLRVSGIAVEGKRSDLATVAKRHGAGKVLIAMPSESAALHRQVAREAAVHGLDVVVLPRIEDLAGQLSLDNVHTVTADDMLGGVDQADEPELVVRLVRGRRVLVTGAAGSVGAELCRRLQALEPELLVMVDRDRLPLLITESSDGAPPATDRVELADLGDRSRVFEMIMLHRPHLVFHTAPLKHLSVLDLRSSEVWTANLVGTSNLLDAAAAAGVERFVSVGTGTAADPIGVLGSTKRLAERFPHADAGDAPREVSEREIVEGEEPAAGARRVHRSIMSTDDAVQLILGAAATGRPGEVLALDLGNVRIVDVDSSLPEPIYLSPPEVRGREREAVLAAIDSGWVAPAGPALAAFEADLAAACGTAGAVALASGTAALHLALLTAGVGPGDDVLLPTLTFVATANAVTYCGARPVFLDVDPATWCLDPALTIAEIERRLAAGRPPKAVVTVDLFGQCADHDPIMGYCRGRGIAVVEDAAEGLGATYKGRRAGALADIGVLSFNGNKLITTSGGGAVVGDDLERLDRIRYLATQARQPVTHYEHTEIGFNYRMSNVLAALGRAQLETLGERMADRHAVRGWYAELFAGVPGVALNPIAAYGEPNHWLTCVTVDPAVAPFDAAELVSTLAADNVESRPLWKPLHLQPLFAGAERVGGDVAADLFARGVTLPSASRQPGFHDRIQAAVKQLL